jgi:hypothetical protein
MGAKVNVWNQKEDQNTITLSKEGILLYVKNMLKGFHKISDVLNQLEQFMKERKTNSICEDDKNAKYKDNKWTEKKIEIFSCKIECSDYNEFVLSYYYYYAYYLEYKNFTFINDNEEKNFKEIRQTIDENFKSNNN